MCIAFFTMKPYFVLKRLEAGEEHIMFVWWSQPRCTFTSLVIYCNLQAVIFILNKSTRVNTQCRSVGYMRSSLSCTVNSHYTGHSGQTLSVTVTCKHITLPCTHDTFIRVFLITRIPVWMLPSGLTGLHCN